MPPGMLPFDEFVRGMGGRVAPACAGLFARPQVLVPIVSLGILRNMRRWLPPSSSVMMGVLLPPDDLLGLMGCRGLVLSSSSLGRRMPGWVFFRRGLIGGNGGAVDPPRRLGVEVVAPMRWPVGEAGLDMGECMPLENEAGDGRPDSCIPGDFKPMLFDEADRL
jgi:hypothetical protein